MIGNDKYQGVFASLPNPANDVRLVSAALRELGFDVDVKYNLTRVGTLEVLRDFRDRLITGGGTGLFYYAGYWCIYWIDKYEVTVRDYRHCVDASGCTQNKLSQAQYCNWNKLGRDRHPINCVDWYQAKTYCKWSRWL